MKSVVSIFKTLTSYLPHIEAALSALKHYDEKLKAIQSNANASNTQ